MFISNLPRETQFKIKTLIDRSTQLTFEKFNKSDTAAVGYLETEQGITLYHEYSFYTYQKGGQKSYGLGCCPKTVDVLLGKVSGMVVEIFSPCEEFLISVTNVPFSRAPKGAQFITPLQLSATALMKAGGSNEVLLYLNKHGYELNSILEKGHIAGAVFNGHLYDSPGVAYGELILDQPQLRELQDIAQAETFSFSELCAMLIECPILFSDHLTYVLGRRSAQKYLAGQ